MELRDALRAEFGKALSLPWSLLVLGGTLVLLPVLGFWSGRAADPGSRGSAPMSTSANGFEVAGFGQPLVVVLAVLIMTTEYDSGQIRSSLAAVPRRGVLLLAKALVVVGLVAAVAPLSMGITILVERAVLSGRGIATGDLTGAVWTTLGTVTLNWVLMSLIGFGLAVLTRSTVLALSTLLPLVLGVSLMLFQFVPAARYLPDLAGVRMLGAVEEASLLAPVPGALVMTGWAAALTLSGALVFLRRDA